MSNLPAVQESKLPATIDLAKDSMIGREGMGLKDIALPYLSILQALSPQVKKSDPKRIQGAEEGDLFNTVTEELYGGNDGVVFVPCAYQRCNVEWMPRDSGGGFVAQHFTDDILAKCTRNERGFDVLPSGNIVVTTAYYYGMLLDEGNEGSYDPIILSLARTQLKKSRRWNAQISAIQVKSGETAFNPPMFASKWKLTTVPEQKKDYSWFGIKTENLGLISNPELYAAAKKLAQDVSRGLVKAATPVETEVELNPTPGAAKPGGKKDDLEDDIPF